MKLKKLFTLTLMGITALSATASVQAKELTYKNGCVIKVGNSNSCSQTGNKSSQDCSNWLPSCPTINRPSTDCPEWLPGCSDNNCPDVELPSEPDTDKPATNKPGWLPDISVPSKPDTETPDTETPDTSKPGTGTEVSSQTAYENKVLELVNVERSKNGLKPLTMDESVRKVARTKSTDMRQNKYFDHNSPVYGSPFDMLKQFGISYRSAGENIAQGYQTPEAVVKGWMNSPGHRANILNSSFTHIGIGYDAQGHYWTQMFIGK